MIRNLRRRPRPDQLVNQQRRSTNRTGRLVYLGMLGVLTLAILNYLYGDLVMLRADGLVLRDSVSIATTYVARVDAVAVEKGQAVSAGDTLVVLQSSEMLEQLADLSSRRARLAADAADFKIRADTVEALLPLAERREREATKSLVGFDQLSDRQLVTNARHDQALTASFDASQSLVRLRAERDTLKDELAALDAARADADSALKNLRAHYADGIVRAPAGGTVGSSVATEGDVVRTGETMMSIYTGEPHVLAYLPRNYLFAIRTGMEVSVGDGQHRAIGIVSDILPVADALPEEFQNTFSPRDRNQLARITFESPAPFPIHGKVRVSRRYF